MEMEHRNQGAHKKPSATFVLLHGAWHGGWCYRDTAQVLRAAGHNVYTPTLTGLGERAHLNNQNITLETHIRDVCGVLEAEELSDVILLGHSYGGMVITGVADRMSDRIKTLVYLDAFVPEHAQSLIDCLYAALSEENAAAFLTAFRTSAMTGNSGLMLPIPAEGFKVEPKNRAWVDRHCSPQALATFETQVLLTGRGSAIKDRLFILAERWDPSPFSYYAEQVAGKPGWRVSRVPCGHDVMVDMPIELANLLLTLHSSRTEHE
ncbi:alpha/beta hydrolase [Paraburkholderia sp. CNPSo 3274]|uniref:alpha/beta fold hydrolase n=1 Tax=Paraburkholderia sp. CNPSo 3274 TaxID=2940932 RepID=UPI0020B89B35|nr:alpha/beta hydrolase [Paraburkholderia sp. CNPSo 3274]MCP3712430.1 alpha/beta hydrolase [Paraburkholderia sp. CNPSo 3274]